MNICITGGAGYIGSVLTEGLLNLNHNVTMISNRSKALGRYHFCNDAVMEHMHWRLGKAERDATNDLVESRKGKNGDKSIKDAMDKVWLHQGGLQKAVIRLREAT